MIRFVKPERNVSRVFIHCTASDGVGPAYEQDGLVKTIDAWHRARGFNGIGYHYVIDKAGNTLCGRNIELIPAAQKGNNSGTIAICVHGLAVKNFTGAQRQSLLGLCKQIKSAYNGSVTFHGHREVDKYKTCPVFAYREWLNLDKWGRML